MSTLKYCDCEDCYQSENDSKIYNIDSKSRIFLLEYCRSWMNYSCDDICEDCIEQINEDYESFFIKDKYLDYTINRKYINNPKLVS